jgi:biopolymer transport protein ExbB
MRLIRRSSQPFLVLGVALLAGVALAPELLAQEAEVAPEVKRTVFDTIKEGGNFMYILGACSLAMVALVIYNFIQLGRSKFVPEDLRSQVHEYMVSCKVRSAIEVASTSPSFLGRMLATALPKIDATEPETLGREHVEDAMADFTARENRSYMTMIGYLGVIAQIAPMLGLMGTVSGMIGAFGKLRDLESPDASVLAENISEALITTLSGLIIAVPAIVFFFILRNRLNRLVADSHEAASDMIDASLNTLNADQQLAKVPEGLSS